MFLMIMTLVILYIPMHIGIAAHIMMIYGVDEGVSGPLSYLWGDTGRHQ